MTHMGTSGNRTQVRWMEVLHLNHSATAAPLSVLIKVIKRRMLATARSRVSIPVKNFFSRNVIAVNLKGSAVDYSVRF